MPSSRTVGRISVLDVPLPQRVLGLQRGDRMDGVRAANRRRRRLGQSEVAHLAGLHELGHRADGLLDRRLRVDAVLVVEVDVVDAQALQRGVAGRAHVLRLAADLPEARIFFLADVGELRGEKDLVAPARDGLADQLFVVADAVDVGGVEES